MRRTGFAIFLICLLVFATGCSKNYVKLYENGDYSEAYAKARESASKYSNRLNLNYTSKSSAKRDAASAAKAYYYMGLCKKAMGDTRAANDNFDLAGKENTEITLKETKSKQVWVDGHYEKQWIPGQYKEGPWVPGHYEQKWVDGHYDTERVWVDGHYEGNVWVDGHYEEQQVWIDGHNEDVWVDGHKEQVWIDGHYDEVYVEGQYETKYYTETKTVSVNISSEWSQRARSERGRTGESVARDAVTKVADNDLHKLKLDMDAAFSRYQKLLDGGEDASGAKQEWLDAKKKFESAK